MRVFSNQAVLKGLTLKSVRKAWRTLTVENQLLRFSDGPTGATTGIATDVPASFSVTGATSGYMSAFTTSGNHILKPFNPASPNFTSSTPTLSLSPASLRGSFYSTSFATATWAWNAAAAIKIYTTAGALSATWASLPETCVNGATLVKRVEAVCMVSATRAIVALGCHEFLQRLSTIKFFLVTATTATELTTIIQTPMADGVTYTSWHGENRHCTYVMAIANNGKITVVANDTIAGRASQFTLSNGVESQIEPVLPIDPDIKDENGATVVFMPTGITKINTLYYLSGYFKRPKTDGVVDRMNVYLTSADAWLWSAGERSHLVSIDGTCGHIAAYTTPALIYYIGIDGSTGRVFTAPARVLDGSGTASTVTTYTAGAQLKAASDAIDTLSLSTTSNAPLSEGDVITLSGGYVAAGGTQYGGQVGKYVVDNIQKQVDGKTSVQPNDVSCMDYAGWRLTDWRSPIDVDRWSATRSEDPLDRFNKLILKTPIRDAEIISPSGKKDVKIDDGVLHVNGLNDPMLGYSVSPDERDGIAITEVIFQDTAAACQQSIALIFGGDQEHFNAVTLPKASGWTGHAHSKPELWTSNLSPVDADTGEGGFTTEARLTGLIESVLAEEFCKLLKPLNATASAKEEAYRPTGDYAAQSGNAYEFAVRTQGGRVQVYAKPRNDAPASIASNATYIILAEYTFNEYARMAYSTRPHWGVAASTDVAAGKDWFSQSARGDLDMGIIKAGVGNPASSGGDEYTGVSWTTDIYPVHEFSPTSNETTEELRITDPNDYIDINKFVWIHNTYKWTREDGATCSWVEGKRTVKSWTWDDQPNKIKKVKFTANYRSIPGGAAGGWANDRCTISIPTMADCYAWATSTYDYQTAYVAGSSGTMPTTMAAIVTNPSGVASSEWIKGRAWIVNDNTDSTAAMGRRVSTNKKIHRLLQDGDTGMGWDYVLGGWPIANPRPWSIKMAHGLIFEANPTTYGLPENDGYFKDEDEIFRYKHEAFLNYPNSPVTEHWCYIPTYYTGMKASVGETSTIHNWAQPVTAQRPGDDLGDIPNPKGLLVEIRSRTDNSEIDPDGSEIVHRIASTHKYTGTLSHDNTSYATLDTPYKVDIVEPTQYKNQGVDYAVISGRAQLGTLKALHDETSPVVYYPMNLQTGDLPHTQFPWLIKVPNFDHYNGLYNSIEDDLRYVCALTGARDVTFGNLGTFSGNLSNITQIVSSEDVSDFVLDMNAHLYGYASPMSYLRVLFRGGSYTLDIATKSFNSVKGAIELRLCAPLSSITPTGGDKLLRVVTVPLSGFDLSGTSGSEDKAKTLNIRLITRENTISVEVEGCLVWVFNLDRYTYVESDLTKNYKVQTAGPVTIQYTLASTGTTVTARLLELGGEVENHIIDMAQSGGEALSFVTGERHIRVRSTQTGGIYISQFRTRDNWSADGTPMLETVELDASSSSPSNVAGHVLMSGAEFGEAVDLAWIRQRGYSFQSAQNSLLYTVQDSRDEARLILGLAKSQVDTRTLACAGIWELQPEDKIDIERTAVGTIPAVAKATYIVESTTMTIEDGAIGMQIQVRKETP